MTHGESRRLEQTLMITALGVLLFGCILVLLPFLSSLLWAAILTFSTWPIYRRLLTRLGGRRVLASLLMTLFIALVLLVPFLIAGFTLAENVGELARATRAWIAEGPPQPPGWVEGLPFVGPGIASYWRELVADSERLSGTVTAAVPQMSAWLLNAGVRLGRGVVELGLSILIAFFLFRDGPRAGDRLSAVFTRLAGTRGPELLETTRRTVRGVVYGVLGTALTQAVVAGIGFIIAGVPGAVLLALFTFFLSAVLPFGPPIVWIPAALWLFNQGNPGWGIFMLVWGMGVSSVDNVVRPYLISHETNLPFLLVFFGALGGVLAFGFIGVFLGPTLLAVAFAIVEEWIANVPRRAARRQAAEGAPPPAAAGEAVRPVALPPRPAPASGRADGVDGAES